MSTVTVPPVRWVASRRHALPTSHLVNVAELFDALIGLPGSRVSGASTDGIEASCLVADVVEFARAEAVDEARLRRIWRARRGRGAIDLVLIADDPESSSLALVLGPDDNGPLRRLRADALFEVVRRAAGLGSLEARRLVAQEIERLDTERIAGLTVGGLGTEHLFGQRLPADERRWAELTELAAPVPTTGGWREVLTGLGYTLDRLPRRGYLLRHDGRPVAVTHPHASATRFAHLDKDGRLPEGALATDCAHHGLRYGLLTAGTRLRLLAAGRDRSGSTTRYLEIDVAALEPARRPLLALLSPRYLAEGGFDDLLSEARDYGERLRERLDRDLRQRVLPILGRELGKWAERDGLAIGDEDVRAELEAAALTWVFRALFLLYAESSGYLPMTNATYQAKSLTRVAARAAEELEHADSRATTLWDDVMTLVKAMRTGQSAWNVPAYNGDLFAADGFSGAAILERAAIPDDAVAPALVALARDPDDPEVGVDFSGLEIGHLGHIYEGLLSLRLSVADRDYRYDERPDRYVPVDDDEPADVRAGELLWLTHEGGRKGGGVYYTRSELVRHLVKGTVRPAFARHLDRVRALIEQGDPSTAADLLFDFAVLDPACGSGHFLVQVVDELADQVAELLGEIPLPKVAEELERLRSSVNVLSGAQVEDTALIKRLVLKRCVYGVDLSPMGAEIAKISLWLATFVPGLSLAYLDHNIKCGNSLVGVARAEHVRDQRAGDRQVALFGEGLASAIMEGARAAAELRMIDDRTPEEFAASRAAHNELKLRVSGAHRVLDLWTAEMLGVAGARDEVLRCGDDLLAGASSDLSTKAVALSFQERFVHWPLAFPEVFARDRPGFDVIVGNPPWDEVTVEELAFYGRYQPGLRGLRQRDRERALAELKRARPELERRFEVESSRLARMRSYFGRGSGYVGGAGDPDVYKYFCQRYRELLREDGDLGVVLPRTTFVNKGSTEFRTWLFDEAVPRRLDFLVNRGRWAFDAEERYSVVLVQASRKRTEEPVEVAGIAGSAKQFAQQTSNPGLLLERVALGPALEVPLLPSQAAADLLAKLRSGVPFPLGTRRWRCFPTDDFHETHDKGFWSGCTTGWPLWKGESFDQFDPHGREARWCPPSESALAKARGSRPGLGSVLARSVDIARRREAVARTVGRARVAFRDVTNRTNSRTVIAALIPPQTFLTNKAPYLAFVDDDPHAEAACLALMNSLAFDWQARRFVETNMNFFILEGLYLPELDDETFDALSTAAARLSCQDERFAEFAAATGVECGPLDDDAVEDLRVEIDARVAHAWRLTDSELDVIFSDFTESAVPHRYRERVRARLAELA